MKFLNKRIKAFTFIEVIITISLFLLLTSVGLGAYFKYYTFSLIKTDVNSTLTLIGNARFRALKNPTSANYGIHIDQVENTITAFAGSYTPPNIVNDIVQLEQLSIIDLSLNPGIGTTDEILFQTQTGKTNNYGSFTIGNENYSYTININEQGVVN